MSDTVIAALVGVGAAALFNGFALTFVYGKLTQSVTDLNHRVGTLEHCVFNRRSSDGR